jgi:PTH2 family peptidyl-tRNA hydrolase
MILGIVFIIIIEMEKPIVQYYIINNDLHMGKGKIASQIAHAAQSITEILIRKAYESRTLSKEYLTYTKWKENCKKIILKAPESELRKLMIRSDCISIIDSGGTQVPPQSLTCIGFYPSSELGDLFKDYKLL